MNTDGKAVNQPEPLFKAETHDIIGFSFAVLNELGHGLNEKLYENALTVEFRLNHIPYDQQRNFKVLYKNHEIGKFIPDLIAYDKIIVDTKVIDCITKLRVGLILNFKHAKLDYERIQL